MALVTLFGFQLAVTLFGFHSCFRPFVAPCVIFAVDAGVIVLSVWSPCDGRKEATCLPLSRLPSIRVMGCGREWIMGQLVLEFFRQRQQQGALSATYCVGISLIHLQDKQWSGALRPATSTCET